MRIFSSNRKCNLQLESCPPALGPCCLPLTKGETQTEVAKRKACAPARVRVPVYATPVPLWSWEPACAACGVEDIWTLVGLCVQNWRQRARVLSRSLSSQVPLASPHLRHPSPRPPHSLLWPAPCLRPPACCVVRALCHEDQSKGGRHGPACLQSSITEPLF